jgi:hypothetical protein
MTFTLRNATKCMTILAALSMVAGCRIQQNDLGEYGNLKIALPFGNMQVKTSDKAVVQELGLPDYPGSVLQVTEGEPNGTTELKINLGRFRLRVDTASFMSTDSPDKVRSFYRSALSQYGEVIECQDGKPISTLTQTSEGLTCDKEKSADLYNDDPDKLLLKAGRKQHQHIVAIDPTGNGSKLQVVAVDLPWRFPFGDNSHD